MRWILAIGLCGQMAHGDGVAEVAKAADSAFDKMPTVVVVDRIAGKCGADANVDRDVAYCTTGNQIFVARDAYDTPRAPYLVAHSYGHAAQVQHGVAEFALRQIRNRRSDEAMLRGFVERQVDCIAGFFISQAGLPAMDLNDLFTQDPLSDVHWGRNPLRIGPVVGVELAARAEWFAIGQGGDLAACAPGEFTAELLLDALRP